ALQRLGVVPISRSVDEQDAALYVVDASAEQPDAVSYALCLRRVSVVIHNSRISGAQQKRSRSAFDFPAVAWLPSRLTGAGGAADSTAMNQQLKAAVEAFQTGDLERARRLAEAEVSATPSAQGCHLLGLVHCRLGDPASGVEYLRAAAEAEPQN